jgi:cyclase
MLKHRLIPVLLLKDGELVRSESFEIHQVIGNPINEVRRFNEWRVDELIYLDISSRTSFDAGRGDHAVRGLAEPLEVLEEVARSCFMPLTWGGRIRTAEDMRARILRGADKVTLNTAAFRTPTLIGEGARLFGSQAIVVSIDVLRSRDGKTEVRVDGGRAGTGRRPADWAREVEDRGAGEILLQSIDRDGTGEGYDLDLVSEVASAVRIPVIACGGVGRYEDYAAGIRAGASAAAAANIWHFKEMADWAGRQALLRAGVDVRTP